MRGQARNFHAFVAGPRATGSGLLFPHQRGQTRERAKEEREMMGTPVPSPSNNYRDRVCKIIEMTGFYPTILKCPDTWS